LVNAMTDEILPAGRDDGVPPFRFFWGGGGGNDNDNGRMDGNENNGNGNVIRGRRHPRSLTLSRRRGWQLQCVLMVGLADHLFIKNKKL